MVNLMKITVEDGKLVIPGSVFGLENGQQLVVTETDSGLSVTNPTKILEKLSQGLEESGASVEDALAHVEAALEREFAEKYALKD